MITFEELRERNEERKKRKQDMIEALQKVTVLVVLEIEKEKQATLQDPEVMDIAQRVVIAARTTMPNDFQYMGKPIMDMSHRDFMQVVGYGALENLLDVAGRN